VGNKYDPYNPESVKSWEVGEKGEFFNHRLRVNVDLFSSSYTNFQATILTPVSTGVGASSSPRPSAMRRACAAGVSRRRSR
jgi:iron complex outermembrane receptor protein